MPLPVISDIWRVAFEWNCSGALATNVMHFRDTSGDPVTVFNNISAAVTPNMWNLTNDNAIIEELNIRALDGVDAGHIFSTGGGSDWHGAGGTDYIPQACALVKLNTTRGGRQGTGRVFLPFIAEGNQSAGTVFSANQTACQTAWESFAADVAAAGTFLVVASYASASASDVQTLKVENSIATQRRRWKRH